LATVGTRTAIYGTVLLSGIVSTMLMAALISFLQSRAVAPAATATAAAGALALLLGLIFVLIPADRTRSPRTCPR
jgi:hypothetical protein